MSQYSRNVRSLGEAREAQGTQVGLVPRVMHKEERVDAECMFIAYTECITNQRGHFSLGY